MAFKTVSNDVIASTIEYYSERKLINNIFNATPTLAWLRKNQKAAPGGSQITVPIESVVNTNSTSFARGATMTIDDVDVMNNAQYDWKYYGCPVIIYDMDLLKNSGEFAMVNLLEAKLDNAASSIADDLATDMFATTFDNSGNVVESIALMCDDGNSTSNIGNIDVSNTYWKGNIDEDSEAWDLDDFITVFRKCGKKGSSPDFIVMDDTCIDSYEALAGANITLMLPAQKNKYLLDLGFATYAFKGATVVYDPYLEAYGTGTTLLLNSRFVKYQPHEMHAKKWAQKPAEPYNIVGTSYRIWGMAAITCSRRNALGAMFAKTTAAT